jgi:hypothetical protein
LCASARPSRAGISSYNYYSSSSSFCVFFLRVLLQDLPTPAYLSTTTTICVCILHFLLKDLSTTHLNYNYYSSSSSVRVCFLRVLLPYLPTPASLATTTTVLFLQFVCAFFVCFCNSFPLRHIWLQPLQIEFFNLCTLSSCSSARPSHAGISSYNLI